MCFAQLTLTWLGVSFASFAQLFCVFCLFRTPSTPGLGRRCSCDFWQEVWDTLCKGQHSAYYMQPKLCPPEPSAAFHVLEGRVQWKHFTSLSNCSAAEGFQRWKDLFITDGCEPHGNEFSWKQYLPVRTVSSALIAVLCISPSCHSTSFWCVKLMPLTCSYCSNGCCVLRYYQP